MEGGIEFVLGWGGGRVVGFVLLWIMVFLVEGVWVRKGRQWRQKVHVSKRSTACLDGNCYCCLLMHERWDQIVEERK